MTSTTCPRPKPVLLFAVQALVLALLLGYWPSARDLYPAAFRAGASWVFAREQAPRVVVRPGSVRRDASIDTFLEEIRPGQPEPAWRLNFSALRMGYWPTAALFALLFATPMPARRRALALVAGLLWVGAYAALRLGIDLVRARAELAHGGAAATAEGTVLYLRMASQVLGSNILVIAMVLLAWVALANPQRVLHLGALARLLGIRQGGPSTPGA